MPAAGGKAGGSRLELDHRAPGANFEDGDGLVLKANLLGANGRAFIELDVNDPIGTALFGISHQVGQRALVVKFAFATFAGGDQVQTFVGFTNVASRNDEISHEVAPIFDNFSKFNIYQQMGVCRGPASQLRDVSALPLRGTADGPSI